MAITYTWKITSIKTKDEGGNKDAVVQTYWTKTGTDEQGHTGTFMGATSFTSQEMSEGDTFIPFAELTEEIVLGWIKDIVVGSYEEHVNAQIQRQIDESIIPVGEARLPWASLETSSSSTSS